jgi:hypothetical protein
VRGGGYVNGREDARSRESTGISGADGAAALTVVEKNCKSNQGAVNLLNDKVSLLSNPKIFHSINQLKYLYAGAVCFLWYRKLR